MKRLLTAAVLCAFTAGILGCEASAKVGDPDDTTSSSSYKKTTTYDRDGDKTTVKTETKRD